MWSRRSLWTQLLLQISFACCKWKIRSLSAFIYLNLSNSRWISGLILYDIRLRLLNAKAFPPHFLCVSLVLHGKLNVLLPYPLLLRVSLIRSLIRCLSWCTILSFLRGRSHKLESMLSLELSNLKPLQVGVAVLICAIRTKCALLVRVVASGDNLINYRPEAFFNVKAHLFPLSVAELATERPLLRRGLSDLRRAPFRGPHSWLSSSHV
jgi:hypothetical protein